MSICEEIDDRLSLLARKGEKAVDIRIGAGLWDEFVEEISGTPTMPSEGMPTEYKGVPLSRGGQDPMAVYIDSEA